MIGRFVGKAWSLIDTCKEIGPKWPIAALAAGGAQCLGKPALSPYITKPVPGSLVQRGMSVVIGCQPITTLIAELENTGPVAECFVGAAGKSITIAYPGWYPNACLSVLPHRFTRAATET